MHRCLQVDEILEVIASCLFHKDKHGLANMALACRTFYEPALNQYWCEVDSLSRLLECLPEDICKVERREEPRRRMAPFRRTMSVIWVCVPSRIPDLVLGLSRLYIL